MADVPQTNADKLSLIHSFQSVHGMWGGRLAAPLPNCINVGSFYSYREEKVIRPHFNELARQLFPLDTSSHLQTISAH